MVVVESAVNTVSGFASSASTTAGKVTSPAAARAIVQRLHFIVLVKSIIVIFFLLTLRFRLQTEPGLVSSKRIRSPLELVDHVSREHECIVASRDAQDRKSTRLNSSHGYTS